MRDWPIRIIAFIVGGLLGALAIQLADTQHGFLALLTFSLAVGFIMGIGMGVDPWGNDMYKDW